MLTLEQRLHMLECPTGTVDIVLDTDAFNEIDDQFAIAYALTAEKIHLRALYAAPFSNAHSSSPADGMEKAIKEVLTLLKLAGVEAVFRGAEHYLGKNRNLYFRRRLVIWSAAQSGILRKSRYISSPLARLPTLPRLCFARRKLRIAL